MKDKQAIIEIIKKLIGKEYIYEYDVKYSDIDRMDFANNVVYFDWFQTARIEFLKFYGLNYVLELENNDIVLPVRKADIHYKKPIKYGQNLKIKVLFEKFSNDRIINFSCKIFDGDLKNIYTTANFELVIVKLKDSIFV